MKEHYIMLHRKMSDMDNQYARDVFAEAQRWAFDKMTEVAPSTAEVWLGKLEAICWNNYLSELEAKSITAKFVNQDGSKGPKWAFSQFETIVGSLGGSVEVCPFYNKFALWTTANMLYSDHADSLKEFVSEAELPKLMYRMSIEKLKDPDRPRFVRDYFLHQKNE